MAVPAGPTEVRHVGNGVTTTFTVPFLVIQPSDLSVYVNGAKVTSGYTQSGVGNPSSSVTFTLAPALGVQILLTLEVAFERPNDYQENGDFLARTVNNDYDRIWQALKQLLRYSGRSLSLGAFDVDGQGWYRAKGNGIRDLRDPVNPQDAVTKQWVGDYLDSVTGLVNTTVGIAYDSGTLFDYLRLGLGRVVNTIDDLKALKSFRNGRAFVLGYYASGDGGGGDYSADLTDTTSADNGGSIIVATDGTRWKLRIGSFIDANQFGIMGDGVDRTARMIALRNLIAAMPQKPELVYSCSASGGNYVYNQSANYLIEGFRMSFRGEVKFTNTGSGYAFILDAGLTGTKVGNFRIGSPSNPLIIRGGASTGGGVYMRANIEDFNVHIRCHGCGTSSAALRTEWVVGGVIDFCATPMDKSTGVLAWYQGGKPGAGISLGARGPGEQTCYNVFTNCITNACSNGKYHQDTLGNIFVGGDSEYCTNNGLLTESGALNDIFVKHNFEVNGLDISVGGYCMTFENCDSVNASLGPSARYITLRGGNWGSISILSGAIDTLLDAINYSRGLGAETITDNGTRTTRESCMNLSTGRRENQPKKVTPLSSLPGNPIAVGTWTYTNSTGNTVGIHLIGGTTQNITLFEAGQAFALPLTGVRGEVHMIMPRGQLVVESTAVPSGSLIEGY